MRKCLLVSINSPVEMTGGGEYLRCLISAYEEGVGTVDLHSKGRYRKTFLSDLASRLLLSPSFIFCYFPLLLWSARKSDVLALHSSRLGALAMLFKILFPRKKVIVHFDNAESVLIKQAPRTFSLRGGVAFLDSYLVVWAEKLAMRYCDCATFITSDDRLSLCFSGKKPSEIIPIIFRDVRGDTRVAEGGYLFFCGSFDFFPNVDALSRIVLAAKLNPALEFKVAGRYLSAFNNLERPSNIEFFSDVPADVLKQLFYGAAFFFCPVRKGSGMKVKIAEALSYGVPVLCDRHSCAGYWELVDEGVVNIVDQEVLDKISGLDHYIDGIFSQDSKMVADRYREYFSLDVNVGRLKRLAS